MTPWTRSSQLLLMASLKISKRFQLNDAHENSRFLVIFGHSMRKVKPYQATIRINHRASNCQCKIYQAKMQIGIRQHYTMNLGKAYLIRLSPMGVQLAKGVERATHPPRSMRETSWPNMFMDPGSKMGVLLASFQSTFTVPPIYFFPVVL